MADRMADSDLGFGSRISDDGSRMTDLGSRISDSDLGGRTSEVGSRGATRPMSASVVRHPYPTSESEIRICHPCPPSESEIRHPPCESAMRIRHANPRSVIRHPCPTSESECDPEIRRSVSVSARVSALPARGELDLDLDLRCGRWTPHALADHHPPLQRPAFAQRGPPRARHPVPSPRRSPAR